MFTAESLSLLVKDVRRRTGNLPETSGFSRQRSGQTQRHSLDQDDGRDGVKVSDPADPA